MSAQAPPATEDRPVPGLGFQWFGVVGGQAAWAIVLLVSYGTVPIACDAGTTLPLYAVRLAGTAVAVAATLAGWVVWRRAEAVRVRGESGARLSRSVLMGAGGFALSAAGVVLIVVEALAIAFIDPCL